jgi:cyclase
MTRGMVLGLLIAAGMLSLPVAAYLQPAGQPQARVVEVDKLRDNLFILRGGGGNTAVFVQANGVTVVDTKNPGWGQPILEKIKELTNKPVSMIINTHTHGDHVSGNVEFPATVDIVVHENTAANMKKMAPVTGFPPPEKPMPSIFEQNQGRGLPKRTFKDQMTLGSGADQIDLHYFGRGHTNGDTWVVFPALKIMHAGDMFPGKQIPIIDANNGGSGVEYPETLSKAHAAAGKMVETIITGHSTPMKPADLQEFAQFNRDFLNTVREAKKAGRSVDEVAKSYKVPEKYAGFAAPQEARLRANVQSIFNELP